MVKNDRYSFYKPFMRAKGSCFRPEYIMDAWEHLDGSTWRTFNNPVGIRCRGFMFNHANESAQSCSEKDPCLNGGICFNLKLTNETICRCDESYTGLTCNKRQKRCSKYLYDPNSVTDVLIYGLESSDIASVFCKDGYTPQYFLSQCVTRSYSSKWSPTRQCYRRPITPPPFRTTPRKRVDWEPQKEPFNFDDYPAAEPVILTVVCLLQALVPIIHMMVAIYRDKSGMRVVSMHAFASYLCWWMYLLACKIFECHKYGKVMQDLSLMSIIMIPLSYVFMLIESCCSPEKQYISSILTDVSVVEFLQSLKCTDPERVMTIECYHWETRTRTVFYTDSNGNTQSRTETYQEIVITYTEQKIFPIACVEDKSDPEGPRFDVYRVTRLKLTPDVQCGDDETLNKFHEMRDHMIEENEFRDEHISFTYNDVIDGFKKRVCAYTDQNYKPFWMNTGCYWIAAVWGLTWPFRIVFNWKTKRCEYTIKKLIYASPRSHIHQTMNEASGLSPSYNPTLDGSPGIDNPGATPDSSAGVDTPGELPNQPHPLMISSLPPPHEPPPAYSDVVYGNTGV